MENEKAHAAKRQELPGTVSLEVHRHPLHLPSPPRLRVSPWHFLGRDGHPPLKFVILIYKFPKTSDDPPVFSRELASKILEWSRQYPVVTVTGPRQSGKTTLVRHLFPQHHYVSLEEPDQRAFAREDPRSFLDRV